jgi:hypothetical protein
MTMSLSLSRDPIIGGPFSLALGQRGRMGHSGSHRSRRQTMVTLVAFTDSQFRAVWAAAEARRIAVNINKLPGLLSKA